MSAEQLGYQIITTSQVGDPSQPKARGWVETGEIDKRGHDLQIKLASLVSFEVIRGAMAAVTSGTLLPGGGGSAIPCGLVLPAASAKLEFADFLPEVSPAAASY